MKLRHTLALTTIACVAIGSAFFLQQQEPQAADHVEAPGTIADTSLDITDFYAWHKGSGANQKLITVLNYDGLKAPIADQKATYNDKALYAIHIDNSGDNIANITIYVRFGKNPAGEWGVQVLNLPGSAGPVIGAVETSIDGGGGSKVWTGLRDDPFFFDLDGFKATLATAKLSFDPTRDSFEGTNVSSIVIEVPMSAALGGGDKLKVWATTAKK